MGADAFYPLAPANVPPAVTRLDGAYRWRVAAMIGGLFLFLLIYLVFIAAAGLLAYGLIIMPMPDVRGRGIIFIAILKFGGAFAAILLWLFLVKGLFKGRRVERSSYLPLEEADHPELFAFIRRVYQDTGAPRPRRVYVSPEVNAALVYDTSLLSLIVPPRKDLLIGLGVVNVVTLAEFKAVLAHEFGHFAQRSVGLGSYLYIANQVMSDVIYSRDGLDRFVDGWSAQDIRIAFPAWGLKGILWVVRQILAGTFQGLNLLHLSLSRQMEFNADNVAVSVTGSDVLIHGLSRLDFANECLANAAHALNAAADHGLFTDNLFHHQTQAAARLRGLRKDERLGLPPELPADAQQQVKVFETVEDGIPEKYRSHPTNDMRERNAKRIYVRSPLDDRSPWVLFNDAAALQQRVTEHFYRHELERLEPYTPKPAAEVQAFIDAEHAETTYDPKYHGFYDGRFINPGDLKDLPKEPSPHEEIAACLSRWETELEGKMKSFHERQGEFELLRGLKAGELSLKSETFTFRDQLASANDVDRLFTQVDKELDAEIETLHQVDRQVFLTHWSLARLLQQPEEEADLLERYRFHMTAQGLLTGMLGEQGRLQNIFNVLSNQQQFSPDDFEQIRGALQGIYRTLTENLNDAKGFRTPALTNVPAGSSLFNLIVDRGETALPPLQGMEISGEWLTKLAKRLDGVLTRLKRLHFKSLGSLLALQEKLVREWQVADGEQSHEAGATAGESA